MGVENKRSGDPGSGDLELKSVTKQPAPGTVSPSPKSGLSKSSPSVPNIRVITPDSPSVQVARSPERSGVRGQSPSGEANRDAPGQDEEYLNNLYSKAEPTLKVTAPTRNRILLLVGVIFGLFILVLVLGLTLTKETIPSEVAVKTDKLDSCPSNVNQPDPDHVVLRGNMALDREFQQGLGDYGSRVFSKASVNVTKQLDHIFRNIAEKEKFLCTQIHSFANGSIRVHFIIHYNSSVAIPALTSSFVKVLKSNQTKIFNATPILESIEIIDIRPIIISSLLHPSGRSSLMSQESVNALFSEYFGRHSKATVGSYVHGDVMHVQIFPYDSVDAIDLDSEFEELSENSTELSVLGVLPNQTRISDSYKVYSYLLVNASRRCDPQGTYSPGTFCSESFPGLLILELDYPRYVPLETVKQNLSNQTSHSKVNQVTDTLKYWGQMRVVNNSLSSREFIETLRNIIAKSGLTPFIFDVSESCLKFPGYYDFVVTLKTFQKMRIIKDSLEYGLTKYLQYDVSKSRIVLQDLYILRYLVDIKEAFNYSTQFGAAQNELEEVLLRLPTLKDTLIGTKISYILNKTFLIELILSRCIGQDIVTKQFWNTLIASQMVKFSFSKAVTTLTGFRRILIAVPNTRKTYNSRTLDLVVLYLENTVLDSFQSVRPNILLSLREESVNSSTMLIDGWVDVNLNASKISANVKTKVELILLQSATGSSDEDGAEVEFDPASPVWRRLYENYLTTKTFRPTDLMVPTSSVPFWVSQSTSPPLSRSSPSYFDAIPPELLLSNPKDFQNPITKFHRLNLDAKQSRGAPPTPAVTRPTPITVSRAHQVIINERGNIPWLAPGVPGYGEDYTDAEDYPEGHRTSDDDVDLETADIDSLRKSLYELDMSTWRENASDTYTPNSFKEFYMQRMYPEETGVTGRTSFNELLAAILKKMVTKIAPGENCPDGQWKCANTVECIQEGALCDSSVQCSDSSDELSCSCKTRVPSKFVCNGQYECLHGEDEVGCTDLGCGAEDFSCSDGSRACFPQSKRCDGVSDCSNGVDEKRCFYLAEVEQGTASFANSLGVLHGLHGDTWHPLCGSSLAPTLANEICKEIMGEYQGSPKVLFEKSTTTGPFLSLLPTRTVVTTCSESLIIVQCPDPPCGERAEREKGLSFSRRSVQPVSKGFDIDERIVGGKSSESGMWPWVAGIYKDGKLICGGSIITKSHILSAAHCFSNSEINLFPSHHYNVQVGLYEQQTFSPLVQTRNVVSIVVHENFNKEFKNDVAILKLDHPIQFNRFARPMCLAEKGYTPAKDQWCTVVGWGALYESGPASNVLQELEMPILDRCLETFNDDNLQICSGFLSGGKDSCQGDSGGPLICRNQNNSNSWLQVGVVSFGRGCARKNSVGVYSRVSQYRDWITNNLEVTPKSVPMKDCPGFTCKDVNGLCLDAKYVCDKKLNCMNSEDEMNCNPT